MLEGAHKKAKRAEMPIVEVELVMMASTAVLAAGHFVRNVDDWEGLPTSARTWNAWKQRFKLAHLRRQQQLLAAGGLEPLGGANGVFLPTEHSSGQLAAALDNLALEASMDLVILQQLTAANLALTLATAVLTATNKALVDLATKTRAAANAGGTGATNAVGTGATTAGTGRGREKPKPIPNSYCWTHGHKVYGNHLIATCTTKADGHHVEATYNNTMGGSKKNKGWGIAFT